MFPLYVYIVGACKHMITNQLVVREIRYVGLQGAVMNA